MKRIFTLLCIVAFTTLTFAQTTILDFEAASTSTVFQHFGSSLDGQLTSVVANPNPTGVNTSANVMELVKPAGPTSLIYAGAFSNPNPTTPFDLTTNNIIKVKVHMPQAGQVGLKLEGAPTDADGWINFKTVTTLNEWVELEYDVTQNSAEGSVTPATGLVYPRIVMFFDFGNVGGATDVTYYFDDIITTTGSVVVIPTTPFYDFETPETGNVFSYFGNGPDGLTTEIIPNPNASGINTSANVSKFVKQPDAQTWAGAGSLTDPTIVLNMTTSSEVRVKVHMDHIGTVSMKLEGSTNGGQNWITTVPNTLVNEWEELVFDASLPSIEAPGAAATGYTYTKAVIFFDFGIAGTGVEQTFYFDDVKGGGDVVVPVTTPVLDFETPSTTTNFFYFGSALDGTLANNIANPNPSGINTSSTVVEFVKPADALVYAGAFSLDNPTIQLNMTEFGLVSVKVHMDHLGSVSLKMENSTDGGDVWLGTVSNTLVNQWEEILFDVSVPSLEAPNTAANGHTYTRAVIFFDFGTVGTGTDVISYFDEIKAVSSPVEVVTTPILDFETETTTTPFQYFGSALDGSTTEIISNPNATGANTSATVVKYVKPSVAETWAGAFSQDNPTIVLTMTPTNKYVSIMVHMDHIGVVGVKLENSTDGGADWLGLVSNTVVNQWEELRFDVNLGSNEAPFEPAVNHTYEKVVVFFDFGTAGTGTDVTSYFDQIQAVAATGSNDVKAGELFTLLGNPPTSGYTTLDFGNNSNRGEVTLSNAMGQTLKSWNNVDMSQRLPIETSELATGMYFVTVISNGLIETQKLVK